MVGRGTVHAWGKLPWIFLCDTERGGCGALMLVPPHRISAWEEGRASCRCAKAARTERRTSASGVRSPEYNAWKNMRDRCNRPAVKNFSRYGGRGIAVCERWESFENFLADMGPKPSPDHSIDRVNNDRGYEPGNCAWATRKTQSRNRRTTRLLTHAGETLCVAEWAERLGISARRLYVRLNRGWSTEKALTAPLRGRPSTTRTVATNG